MLDLQNFQFLRFPDLLHFVGEAIGELLQAIFATFQLIFRNFLLFLTIAQFIMSVTTNIANGDFVLVQFLVEDFDHFTTSLLVERWNSKANHLAIVVRINTQVRFLNGFFYINQKFPIPGLNYQQTRFRNTNISDLVDGRRRSIVIDCNSFHKRQTGAASANGREVLFQDLNCFLHTSFSILENIVYHSNAPFIGAGVTPVPPALSIMLHGRNKLDLYIIQVMNERAALLAA